MLGRENAILDDLDFDWCLMGKWTRATLVRPGRSTTTHRRSDECSTMAKSTDVPRTRRLILFNLTRYNLILDILRGYNASHFVF